MSDFSFRCVLFICLIALAPKTVLSQEKRQEGEAGSSYLAFGISQLYDSRHGAWIFLDVHSIPEDAGYERPTKRRRKFVAMRADNTGSARLWRTDDDRLTANSNLATFLCLDGSVYAVRNDLRVAWRLTTSEKGESLIQEIPVASLVDPARSARDSLKALREKSAGNGFRLLDAGNFGYGQSAPSPVTPADKPIRIRFESRARTFGWQTVIVEHRADGEFMVRHAIDVHQLMEGNEEIADDGKAAEASPTPPAGC